VTTAQAGAAAANAAWCDLVCRAHGLAPVSDERAWATDRRAPALYPDAVTLDSTTTAAEVLARIDTGPGCSVKDSFACLDLGRHGFRVLFDATWIRRPASPPADPVPEGWSVVTDEPALTSWEAAWRSEGGTADVLVPSVLGDDAVTVLAARRDGRVVAGALLHDAQPAVTSISNLFGVQTRRDWEACVGLAAHQRPASALVGYALDPPPTSGFHAVGPLRVWIHD
jgi:hypothetical protein